MVVLEEEGCQGKMGNVVLKVRKGVMDRLARKVLEAKRARLVNLEKKDQ